MPHLRLEVPEEWLREEFTQTTGFDAHKLLDHLVQVIEGMRMTKPDTDGEQGPLMNLRNLKHAIVPLRHAHVAGDASKRFLHLTFALGNELPGRTAEVRAKTAHVLGDEIDKFAGELSGLASVTVHIQDIDRARGYSTTLERNKMRDRAQ